MFRLTTTFNSLVSRRPFDTNAPDPGSFKLLEYKLNRNNQCFRLSLIHQRTVIHLFVTRTPASDGTPLPFETLVYDTVEPSWVAGTARKVPWLQRHTLKGKKQPDIVYELEEQLYQKVAELLPAFLKVHARPASQLFVKLATNPSTNNVELSLIGDVFRDTMAGVLPALSPDDCKEVPRVDMAMIDNYVDRWVDHVWLVDAIIPPSTSVTRAVFKTTRMPFDGQATAEHAQMPQNALTEAKRLASFPPHPNVLGAPLALVTVVAGQDKGDDINTPHDNYVGMLLPYYTGSLGAVGFKTEEDLKRRLRYCQQFASGVRHLNRSGVFIGDVDDGNTVISAPPPNDRLILIDFEPLSFYANAGGLIAPEADGSWDVSQDSDSKLVYQHCNNPVSKISTIRTEWANIPQALERLEVFGVGTTLAALLKCSVCFPWKKDLQRDSIHHIDPNTPSMYANQEWEARILPAFKDLVQRCCSYDPRDRPLLDDIVSALEQCT